MRQCNRRWWWVVVVGLVAWLGCTNGSSDPCDGMVCPPDQRCEQGECVEVSSEPCEPRCEEDEICQQGRCIASEGGCDYHGQACASGEHLEWDDELFCIDWETGMGEQAQCSQDCRTQACPERSECFLVVPGIISQCDSDAVCGTNEVCHDGQCMVATCRPSDCDIRDGLAADCAAGERCDRIGEQADYCIPEGTRQIGESCIGGLEALETDSFPQGCVADAVCVAGICEPYCESGQCSDETKECVTRSAGGADVEVCVATCAIGEQDECDEMETCVPIDEERGVCQSAGSIPAFEPCEPNAEACEPGTICAVDVGGERLRRCLPVCNLGAGPADDDGIVDSEAQAARDATCPQPDSEEGLWMVWHLAPNAEAVDFYLDEGESPAIELEPGEMAQWSEGEAYQIRPAGRLDWEVRQAGAPVTDVPALEGDVDLGAGETKLLVLQPEAGRDRQLQARVFELASTEPIQWIQGIPDLGLVDLWAIDDSDEATLWIESFAADEAVPHAVDEGVYELRMMELGADVEDEPVVTIQDVEISDQTRLMALQGTVEPADIHSIGAPLFHDEEVPDVEAMGALSLSCRAANDGDVGACMESCRGVNGLSEGRCRGEAMGCGPWFFADRSEWATMCRPTGDGEKGDACFPQATQNCVEGLYCQAYGSGAQGTVQGLCSPLCMVDDGEACGEGQGCRAIDDFSNYELGECRYECEPGANYEDPNCPQGLRQCLPEGRLVPAGDEVGGRFDIEEQQPYCWPSGPSSVGESCLPGECAPDGECIYGRSRQTGFVETLLSPYVGSGAAGLACRAICDPFTGEYSDHQCSQGQTCLFNYPWNANAGHCAEIAEDPGIGEPCEEPGLACGTDAICVLEDEEPECMRFCQFMGTVSDGYARSTCPMGYTCHPFVTNIGVCD